MVPARFVLLALVAVAAVGCKSTGSGLEIQIYNRSPDDVALELVPEDVPDPKTSPMYQMIELKRKSMKVARILKGSYHMRVHVDDWEGKRTIKHDELIREDGRIEIFRDSIKYREVKDTISYGRILD